MIVLNDSGAHYSRYKSFDLIRFINRFSVITFCDYLPLSCVRALFFLSFGHSYRAVRCFCPSFRCLWPFSARRLLCYRWWRRATLHAQRHRRRRRPSRPALGCDPETRMKYVITAATIRLNPETRMKYVITAAPMRLNPETRMKYVVIHVIYLKRLR